MDSCASDPGARKFGNFINYYKFRSPEERINLLPDNVWLQTKDLADETPYLVLDVGCNEGLLTKSLFEYLSKHIKKPIYVLGVDLDAILIERAQENTACIPNIDFLCVDVMKDEQSTSIENYLKEKNAIKFDAVCCFSITMWIHLNHDDNGLKQFLHKFSNLSKLFIIEPQPWKCYRTAVRRMRRSANDSFPKFDKLKWRENVVKEIRNYLEGSLHLEIVHETDSNMWKRKIWFCK